MDMAESVLFMHIIIIAGNHCAVCYVAFNINMDVFPAFVFTLDAVQHLADVDLLQLLAIFEKPGFLPRRVAASKGTYFNSST